jgi:hypothetical protein
MSISLFYGPSGYPGPDIENNTQKASCLLEGTLIKTPYGYKRIESLRVGDNIICHNNNIQRIIKTQKWKCNIENKSDISKRIYKIPSGKQNNTLDLYLSFFHRIFSIDDGWLRKPISLGYKEATNDEITKNKDGTYYIYHIRIENGEKNHLIVNGGCFVESWVDIPDI